MTATWLSSGGKPFNFSVKPPVPVIDWSNPLTKGLVAAVDYSSSSGTNARELVGNIAGTFTGSTPSFGPYGTQRTFNGNTDQDLYTLAPSQIIPTGGKVSGEVLIFNGGFNVGSNGNTMLSKGNNVGSQPFFNMRFNPGTPANIELYAYWNGSFASWQINSNTLNNGQWYHIVMTYDYGSTSNVPIFYVNGIQQTVATGTAPSGSPGPDDGSLYIGNTSVGGGTRGFNGNISYGRVWNRLLSQPEILSLYQNPWQIYAGSGILVPELFSSVSAIGASSLGAGGKLPFGPPPDNLAINYANELAQSLVFDAAYAARGGGGNIETVSRRRSTFGGALLPQILVGPQGPVASFPAPASTSIDSYSNLPAATAALSKFTLEVLMNPVGTGPGFAAGGFDRVVSKGSAEAWAFCYDTGVSVTNGLMFQQNASIDSGRFATPNGSVPLGQWSHVVFVYDNSSLSNVPTVYINGVTQSVTTFVTPVGTITVDDSTVNLGDRTAGDRGFNGLIKYARLYNKLLSPQECAALYSNPWQVYRAPASLLTLSGGVSYTLGAAQGTIVEIGEPAAPKVTRLLSAPRGNITLAGQAAVLRHGYTLPAGQAGFVQTGQAALFGIKMPVVQGSFALSGGAANLVWTAGGAHIFVLTSAAGSFVLAGQFPALKAGRKVGATNSAIGLTGLQAILARGKKIGAVQGSFVLSGKAASFHAALSIKAQCGTVILAVEMAELKKSGWSVVDPNGAAWTPQLPSPQAWLPAAAEETTWIPN